MRTVIYSAIEEIFIPLNGLETDVCQRHTNRPNHFRYDQMKYLTPFLTSILLILGLSSAHASSVDQSVDQFAVQQSDTPDDDEKKKKEGEEEEPDC